MIWVAEIGSSHKGNKALAYELIRQSECAGATICKFQLGWTDEAQKKYAGNVNKIRYIDDWAHELKEWCDYFDIEFMASIWSEDGAKTAYRVGMERIKIGHQAALDVDFYEAQWLQTALARTKEFYVSRHDKTGKESIDNISKTIHAPKEYPCLLPNIPEVFSSFGYYGYSSHTPGIADALIAVARGAHYIEKHVTLDKTDDATRDNAFALSFDEFAQMVRIGDEMARMR